MIPLRLAPVAVEHFTDLGYRVVLDGPGAAPSRRCETLRGLGQLDDPQTWQKVSRVLGDVLDPENGGDPWLHRLLKRTIGQIESSANRVHRDRQEAPAAAWKMPAGITKAWTSGTRIGVDFWDQDWRAQLFASATWRQATIPILTLIE